jgi:hypothetical protein
MAIAAAGCRRMGYLELTHPTEKTVPARTALAWLLPFAVAAGALAWQLRLGANSDVSWLLMVADNIADGRRDFIEFNPPGAVFTYLPAIWLARFTCLSPEATCDIVVVAVAAASLALAGIALGRRFAERHNAPLLATVAAVVLLVVPAYAFGQKEHIGAMLLLPFIAVIAARCDGSTPPLWLRICAGVAGGLCIVVKPHFALNIGVLVIISMWRQYSRREGFWRSLFSAENLAAAAVLAIYGAVLALEFPDYFAETAPMMAAAYVGDRLDWNTLLFAPVSILWASIVALTLVAGGFRRQGALSSILLTMSSVSYALFLLQGKGWAYQSYPAISFGLLALTLQLASADAAVAAWPAIGRVAAGFAALAMFGVAELWFDTTRPRDTAAIAAAIEEIAPHPAIAAITADLSLGFPLTQMVHGRWAQRTPSLLIAASVRRRKPDLDPATLARIEPYEILDRDRLRDDIRANRPDILLVENKKSEPFDWLAWARRDREFAAVLDGYAFVRQIDDAQIWRRK